MNALQMISLPCLIRRSRTLPRDHAYCHRKFQTKCHAREQLARPKSSNDSNVVSTPQTRPIKGGPNLLKFLGRKSEYLSRLISEAGNGRKPKRSRSQSQNHPPEARAKPSPISSPVKGEEDWEMMLEGVALSKPLFQKMWSSGLKIYIR